MANLKKAYFFPPAWVYKPGGPIFLGSIISDPNTPQESLNPDNAATAGALPLIVDDQQEDFHAVIDASRQLGGGFDTSFLSMFTVGGSLDASIEKNNTYTLNIQDLRTQEINPTETYLNEALSSTPVTQLLSRKRRQAELYCVTGLMVGTDVTISSSQGRTRSFKGRIGANAGPVDVGPHFSISSGHSTEASSHRKSEVVVAYRLKRITYMTKAKSFKTKNYTDRAVLADDEEVSPPEQKGEQQELVANVVQLDEDEIGAEDFDLPAVVARSAETGSSEFEFAVPQEI